VKNGVMRREIMVETSGEKKDCIQCSYLASELGNIE